MMESKPEIAPSPGVKKSRPKKVLPDNEIPEQDNSRLRLVGNWPAETSKQTSPPTIAVHKYHVKGCYPVGEILQHPGGNGAERMTGEEARERERAETMNYDDIRRAAEAHRQVRKFVQQWIEPGMKTLDIAQTIDDKIKQMIGANGLQTGHAFPTGVSLNECAAHYTPNYGEPDVIFDKDSIMKLDYGIHVGGRLVDCAFSIAFDEKFDPLIQASKDGTNTGLREAGIDARLGEIGAAIEEAICSYEIEINGKIVPIKPIANLSGHTTDVYRVHGGKSVPIVKCSSNVKMEEGEMYAIETFASTGHGHVYSEGACSHYMLNYDWFHKKIRLQPPRVQSAGPVLKAIQTNFGSLAWCRRWLEDIGCTKHGIALKSLENCGIVEPYPPLCEPVGTYSSQMEHTILLRPTCKEIVSRGSDY